MNKSGFFRRLKPLPGPIGLFVYSRPLMDRFDPPMISRFNFHNSYPNFWRAIEANRLGAINGWLMFWYATVFLQNGLVLFPKQSLLQSIGMNGAGVHCDANDAFAVELSPTAIALRPIPLEECTEAFERHKRYFKMLAPSLFSV
jgi:hypothetical protein